MFLFVLGVCGVYVCVCVCARVMGFVIRRVWYVCHVEYNGQLKTQGVWGGVFRFCVVSLININDLLCGAFCILQIYYYIPKLRSLELRGAFWMPIWSNKTLKYGRPRGKVRAIIFMK